MTSATPTDWTDYRIGDLGQVVTGKTPSTKQPDNFGNDYPFITIPDLDGRVWIDRAQRSLSEQGAKAIRSSLLPPYAVMMSCIATVGRCGITTKESFTNQQINTVIPANNVDSRYLYYTFTQLGHELDAAGGGGSVYTNVSKSRFSNIHVVLPPHNEQRAIASVLGALDDKIEQNRRTAQALEKLARAIFRAWFVDFEPVKAKAAGATSFPSMPQPVFDALPTRLVDSDIGPVPEGWGVRAIGEIMNIQDGKPINKEDRNSGPYPVFGANGVIGYSETALVSRACVVLGKIGSCGALHRTDAHSWVSNNAFYVTPGISKSLEFVWQVLNNIDFSGYVGGSANPYMPKKNFQHIPVIFPDDQFLAAFEAIARQLRDLVVSNETESSYLAELRDYLLPRLLSGAVRVEVGHG